MNLAELIRLLRLAYDDSEMRPTLIRNFQKLVWNFDGIIHNESVDGVIRDLAYHLEYYEPDSLWRAQAPSFYSDNRARDEIRAALLELERIGVHVE
jgi:hypothetical protein